MGGDIVKKGSIFLGGCEANIIKNALNKPLSSMRS